MAFTKARKAESKLRLAISGPAGSGKTYTALAVAKHLAGGLPVAFIDTERGSASKYARLFDFDVMELEPPFHPNRYIAAIHEAEEAGYAVLIIDSLSHAWTGTGGLLEEHEKVVKRQQTKNSYTAWAEITPIQTRFIDTMLGSKMHIIATMRAKTETVQEQVNGKTQIRKVGMAAVQRDGMEYEFDVVLAMDQANTAVVEKTRCPDLSGAVIEKPGKDLALVLREWLSGEPVQEQPKPAQPEPRGVTFEVGEPPYVPETMAAKPFFNPLADVAFRQRLKKLGYVSVKQVEEFTQQMGDRYPANRTGFFLALEAEEDKARQAVASHESLEELATGTRGN